MIEAEIRAEIRYSDLSRIQKTLNKKGFVPTTSTKRTSVMFFGEVSQKGDGWNLHHSRVLDIRCRITNGSAEVVTKIGQTHASDRKEITRNVTLAEMIDEACFLAHLGFFAKVGSKTTKNYTRGACTVSLVESPSRLAYAELEIMTTAKRAKTDLASLHALAKELHLEILSKKAFHELCNKLTKRDDWIFHGTSRDIQKLKREIHAFGSDGGE